MARAPGPYQRVEGGRLGAVGHIVAIALRAAVGAPVDAQRRRRVEFVARGGQQPALVDRAVDGRLGRGSGPGVSQRAAPRLAARAQGVGGHQELRRRPRRRRAAARGAGAQGRLPTKSLARGRAGPGPEGPRPAQRPLRGHGPPGPWTLPRRGLGVPGGGEEQAKRGTGVPPRPGGLPMLLPSPGCVRGARGAGPDRREATPGRRQPARR